MEKEWLKNKTVVVVGASSGVGKYLAFNLILKFNCKIVAISNDANQMEDFNQRINEYKENFSFYIFDATKEKSWADFSESLKQTETKIDVVVNCVGELPKFTKFENYSQKDINKTINANFFSCIFSTRYLLPFLKQSEEPAIINISCLMPSVALGGTSIYSASKSALMSYTQILSQELDDKFYVGMVILGAVKTDFYKNQNKELSEKLLKRAMHPSKASKNIIDGMCSKKRRMVIGVDTKLLDGFSRLFPSFVPKLIKKILNKKNIKLYD